jgi:hypothetical protein
VYLKRGENMSPAALPFESKLQYALISPDGSQIEIPKELFRALGDFLHGERLSGSITIQFRNGGIAGLEALVKKTYK